MKILISPSKTQDSSNCKSSNNCENIIFNNDAIEINNKLLNQMNDPLFKSYLEIKNDKLLQETINNMKEFETNKAYLAINFYSGTQFKYIDFDSLDDSKKEIVNQNLLIMSAMYGIVFANSMIKPYRLMMGSKLKINGLNLYKYWSKKFNEELLKINPDKLIINLASSEYSKLIDRKIFNVIDVDFKILKNNRYVSVSIISKKCRGIFVHNFASINMDVSKIKEIKFLGFSYNEKLSTKTKSLFTCESENY